MLEENETYECLYCKSTFEFYHNLQEHIDSCHNVNFENRISSIESINDNTDLPLKENKFLKQINKIENEMMISLKYMEKELRSSSEEVSNKKTDIKNYICEDMLDIGSIYSSPEEVEEVNLFKIR
jgi:hypothetical protein